ncbi:MAG TPA: glycosyltransferase [Dehalococcoidia bacterium]|nr:glycosyltransferase [Dehalococcoidia bacterium]
MKVLVVTNMYPTKEQPHFGIFVQEQVKSLRKLGVEIDLLFMDGRASRWNYLKGYPRLWWRLLRKRYDLIHAHYIFAGLVARGQIGTPVVLTHHGPEVFMTWESKLCRWFTRFFHKVIVVSQEMKTRLGVPRAHVIPCGIDMEMFRPLPRFECRRELGLPENKRLVLWAGEPHRPVKRFDLVQEAFERLKQRVPDAELVVLAAKPYTEVPLYMNACDALVLTSLAEGSPMVIKEAMACNLPIVSTPTGDVEEVIGGTAGCYMTNDDPEEIAEKLELALRRNARTGGREDVTAMDLDAISRRIIGVYEEALQGREKLVHEADSLEQGGLGSA